MRELVTNVRLSATEVTQTHDTHGCVSTPSLLLSYHCVVGLFGQLERQLSKRLKGRPVHVFGITTADAVVGAAGKK